MSATPVPQVGEVFVGPLAVKVAKVSIGALAGNDVQFTAQETKAVFNIPANCLVLAVRAYTPTAWTTSVTMTVGDGTDADGFLASAKIARILAT